MSIRYATTDHPVHELIAARWSPCAFEERLVAAGDLRSLFEAARWAPSSFNAQPWSYIAATKDEPEEFERLLSCLLEGNQAWAQAAPVLALGVTALRFEHNGQPNKAAFHDLGLASAHLTFEATARGLSVHQMIGILPDRARDLYAIPDGSEAVTALAIGYAGTPESLPENMRARDTAPRARRPVAEFVFAGSWGRAAPLLGNEST
jgi:nitroreductase